MDKLIEQWNRAMLAIVGLTVGMAFAVWPHSARGEAESQSEFAGTAADTIAAIERERVIRAADLYLIEPVVTVTVFEAERSEGGRHDYYSEGDYWWPNPAVRRWK